MANWKSYKNKKHHPEGDFDVIMIGSGIGGLGAAALLAKEGKKVLVLESHYVIGGFTHVFKRRNYEWDVGIHYIGEVHHEKTLISTLFRYITNGQLKWAEMDKVYDKIIFGEQEYDYVKGRKAFAAQMKEYFPEEAAAIDQYMQEVRAVQKAGQNFFTEKALPGPVAALAGGFLRKNLLPFTRETTKSALERITQNPELRGVLAGQFGDYGLPPEESAWAIHCMVSGHFLRGGAYPVGGSGRIAETIAPVIEAAGGCLLVNAPVKSIKIENNRATGVIMEDGGTFSAPTVISSAGIINTYGHLVPETHRTKLNLGQFLSKVEASVSHVCLYLGFNKSSEELKLPTTNYWVYPDNYDHDQNVKNYLDDPENAPLPVTYISFPSAKDPDWENRYPGRSTVEIITLAPYQWFEQWESGRWKNRGEEYEAFKQGFTDRLLEQLYRFHPHLKEHLDHCELSSPLSTRHFVNYKQGEIYGLAHTPDRFEHRFLKPKTPIKGLWLTGQDIVTCGIGGALAGGLLTASAITGKNLVKKVIKSDK